VLHSCNISISEADHGLCTGNVYQTARERYLGAIIPTEAQMDRNVKLEAPSELSHPGGEHTSIG
jgi:hypothetical protein